MPLLRLLLLLFLFLSGMANAVTMFINHPNLKWNFPLQFDGYVYGSYNYLTQSPYFISGVPDRANDTAENGARLQQAYFSVAHMEEGWGGFADVIVGLDAYYLAPLGWNANFFNLHNVGFAMPETYLQYRWPKSFIKFGMLITLAGYEPYTYTTATAFSHSILDGYAQPGSHIGVRFVQELNPDLNYFVGVGSGWATIEQAARLNMLEVGMIGIKKDVASLTADIFLGHNYLTDLSTSGPTGVRQLVDIYGSYQVMTPVSLGFNLDYGTQSQALLPTLQIGHAAWAGLAGYLTYDWTERIKLSFRAEAFNDVDGYRTGLRQVWKELTLSIIYHPIHVLTLLAETRHDISNVNAFARNTGIGAINNQQSFALTAMINFIQ